MRLNNKRTQFDQFEIYIYPFNNHTVINIKKKALKDIVYA